MLLFSLFRRMSQAHFFSMGMVENTVCVKSIPPKTKNSMQYGYDENDNNNMSNETKRETNYSTTKWNDVNTHTLHAAHKVQQVHQ